MAYDPVTGQLIVQTPQQQPPAHVVQALPPSSTEWGQGVTPPVYVQAAPYQQQVQTPTTTVVPLEQVQQIVESASAIPEEMQQTLQSQQAVIDQLQAAEQARLAAQQAEAQSLAEEEAAAAAAAAAALTGDDRVAHLESRLQDMAGRLDAQTELLAREARYNELSNYRNNRLNENVENIHPLFYDMVPIGETEAQIDAGIQLAIEKSQALSQEVEQEVLAPLLAQQQQPDFYQGAVPPAQATPAASGNYGVSPTGGAPVGPLEQGEVTRSLDVNSIRTMSMAEYHQHRGQLLQSTVQAYYQGR